MLIFVAFERQKGAKWDQRGAQNDQNGSQEHQNGATWRPGEGQDHPKDVSREGSAKRSKKRRATAGKTQATGTNMASFLEPCGVFLGYFPMFFQGRFLIDLLMFVRWNFDGFWVFLLVIFGPFSKTPEPLFFDNSTVL